MKCKEVCGCLHNGIEWIHMCDVHRIEMDDIGRRWSAERRNPTTPTTIRYHGQAKPTEPLDWLTVPAGTT